MTTKSRKFTNGKGRTGSRSRRWSSRSGSAAEAASRAEAGGRRPLPAPPEPRPPRRDWGRREGPGRARQDLCATRLHTGLEPTPGGPRPRGQQTPHTQVASGGGRVAWAGDRAVGGGRGGRAGQALRPRTVERQVHGVTGKQDFFKTPLCVGNRRDASCGIMQGACSGRGQRRAQAAGGALRDAGL